MNTNNNVLPNQSKEAREKPQLNEERPKVVYYNALVARNGHHSKAFSDNRSHSSIKEGNGPGAYGVPTLEKTYIRGIEANKHVGNEIIELCKVIKENGTKVDQEGHIGITFKRLFDIYINISNKVVGILLRARKYGLVDFRGEMLFQGRDDNVLIKLIKMDF